VTREDEQPDYQQIAVRQGATIIRLLLALKVARAWGVNSHNFHADTSFELAKWIDEGADKPLPYFRGPFFDEWAKENGLSNCGGKLGYRLTAKLTP
jgi:hypothetical protein